MEYAIEKTQEAIDDLLNLCTEQENEGGSKYPGMTFEQGIQAGIRFITEPDEPNPLDD